MVAFARAFATIRQTLSAILGRTEDKLEVTAVCMRESEFYRKGKTEDGIGRMIHFDQSWFILESHASEDSDGFRDYFIYCDGDIVINVSVHHAQMYEAIAELKDGKLPLLFESVIQLRGLGEQYMFRYRKQLTRKHREHETSFSDPPVVVVSVGDRGHMTMPNRLLT